MIDEFTNSPPLTNREFHLLRNLIHERFGINLTEQKKSFLVSRLNKVLKLQGFKSFEAYYRHVTTDKTGQALLTLINRVTTNHTYFYRESDHFQFFQSTILPELAKRFNTSNTCKLHIWCPGCSTGEEPYLLAILILKYLGSQFRKCQPGILATDISTSALEKAKMGIYDNENVKHLPITHINNYFSKIDDSRWKINPLVKNLVSFKRLNLVRSNYPFKGKFQIIFCRNVMIYFDKATREQILTKFHRYLETDGYLFIGHSETLGGDNNLFSYVKPAIYKKE